MRLEDLGPDRFVKAAIEMASLNPEDTVKRVMTRSPGASFQSFENFIHMLDKFVGNKYALDAAVFDSVFDDWHLIVVWCIRDHSLRDHGGRIFLPGSQEGMWTATLETCLVCGVPKQFIQECRENLHLTPPHVTEDEFFDVKEIPSTGGTTPL